ncbi:unnamed protein product [Tenebrio molitor]|nr:unnamed protein product [Tenebrio molitor]
MTRRQRERSQSLVRLYLASAMDWVPACGEDEGVWSRCTQRGARGRRHSLMSASMWVAVDVPRRWLLGLVSTWLVPNVLASALLVPFVMASRVARAECAGERVARAVCDGERVARADCGGERVLCRL